MRIEVSILLKSWNYYRPTLFLLSLERGKKNRKIKSYLATFPKTGKITSVPYTMKSGQGETTEVMLHAYWLPKRKDWFVCISWMITSDQHIYEYCHRWGGIETSYRLLKIISVSTTTNNPTVRFLYLCFSLLVLTLYVCFRASVIPSFFTPPSNKPFLKRSSSVTLYFTLRCLRSSLYGGEVV